MRRLRLWDRVAGRFRGKKLRTRYFVLFMAVFLAIAVPLNLYIYNYYATAAIHQAGTTGQAVLKSAQAGFSYSINDVYSLIKQMNASQEFLAELGKPQQDAAQTERVSACLEDFLERLAAVKSLRLFFPDRALGVGRSGLRPSGEAYLGTDWYSAALRGQGSIVCRPSHVQSYGMEVSGADTACFDYQEPVISFVSVLKDEHMRTLAVVSVDVASSAFNDIFDGMGVSKGSFFFVVTGEGAPICSTRTGLEEGGGASVYADYLLSEKAGSAENEIRRIDGQRCLISQRDYYFEGWRFFAVTALSELLIDRITFLTAGLPVFLYFCIAALLLSAVMSHIAMRPLKTTVHTIDRIRGSDFSSRVKVEEQYEELREIYTHFNEMLDSVTTLTNENYEITLREKDAQIKALESQINSHFLYNTLDIINWRVYELGGEEVCGIVSSLSSILRYSLNSARNIVSLGDEINQIKNYLNIQTARYEDRFTVCFDLRPETMGLYVHKLLLQPIVENAIEHGFADRELGGMLAISSRLEGEHLFVEIYDNGCGIQPELAERLLSEKRGSALDCEEKIHIGLSNVHNRLRYYYGAQYGITIDSEPGAYTRITLHYPAVYTNTEGEMQL
ncbi:sensor histidine kinase [Oscillospiraceae bacterium]|nr:sensor histidine kinase [Oscillospiraceae bacterium]BDF73519.1 sensor histidine kinase [Oscillospiraceae bacterium]